MKKDIVDTIRQQKQFGKDLLSFLYEKLNRDFYILGGAPRDWACNEPIKDFDIFISESVENKFVNGLLDFAKERQYAFKALSSKEANEQNGYIYQKHIKRVHNFSIDTFLVNVIVVEDENSSVDKILSKFGCNLSKIGFNRNGTTFITEEAMNDIMHNTVTFSTDNKYYCEKITAKYKKFRPVMNIREK